MFCTLELQKEYELSGNKQEFKLSTKQNLL